MKVLFVLDSLFGGGTERSTVVLLPYLRDLGVEATVAVLRRSPGNDQAVADSGATVVVLEGRSRLQQVRALRRLIRDVQPDVVHTALFAADVVGRLAAWRSGARVVSSLVNTPYDSARLNDPNVRRWKLRMVQVIDAVTARLLTDRLHSVSVGVAEANSAALRYPLDRIVTVERGRATEALGRWSAERRRRVRDSLGLADDTPVVLSLGRHEYQKAHVDLVKAVELLQHDLPGLRVLIAGPEGNATAALRAALDERPSLAGTVSILGHRDDAADLLVAADVLAISSHWEGTAGVALEAMALRCPVVSTDVAGLRGVLNADDTALLVAPGAPPAMAEAIRRVVGNRALAERLRDAGEAAFEERFTLERSAARMVEMYRDLLSQRAR